MKLVPRVIVSFTFFVSAMFVHEVSTGEAATSAETLATAEEFIEPSGALPLSPRAATLISAPSSVEALVNSRLRRLEQAGRPIVLRGRVVGRSFELGVWPKALGAAFADAAPAIPLTRVVLDVLASRSGQVRGNSFHILFLGGELANGDTLSIADSGVPAVGEEGIFFAVGIAGEAYAPLGAGFVPVSSGAETFAIGSLQPMRIADALSHGGDKK